MCCGNFCREPFFVKHGFSGGTYDKQPLEKKVREVITLWGQLPWVTPDLSLASSVAPGDLQQRFATRSVWSTQPDLSPKLFLGVGSPGVWDAISSDRRRSRSIWVSYQVCRCLSIFICCSLHSLLLFGESPKEWIMIFVHCSWQCHVFVGQDEGLSNQPFQFVGTVRLCRLCQWIWVGYMGSTISKATILGRRLCSSKTHTKRVALMSPPVLRGGNGRHFSSVSRGFRKDVKGQHLVRLKREKNRVNVRLL